MKLRDLAVVGLATSCSGRGLRLRQVTPYDANSTATADTTLVEYSSTTTTLTTPSTTESGTSSTQLVAPVPYSSQQSSPTSLVSTTTTLAGYTPNSSGGSAVTPTTYSSQQYSFAPSPVGPGTAPPSGTSPAGTTAPPTYGPTGTAPVPPSTSYQSNATNATCSGATLNVLDASLDWWYTKTLYHAVSTVSIQFNRNDSSTGWTVLPATTTFNVESALAQPDCTSTKTWVPSANASLFDTNCTPAASPIAADTTVITQTAYTDPPSTTGNGTLPKLVVTPPPASISVADATQAPYTQGTPFVFFSQYEIVTKSATVFANGSAGCAEATQTYTMDQAFSFEYTGSDVNGSALVNEGVVGDVNPALLGLVGQDTAVAGSWVAEPTVVLLMQEVFVAEAALAATVEPTASELETPTPTNPSFVTLAPTGPNGPPKITQSPRVESTQTALLLPTQQGDDNRPTGVAAEQTQGGSNNNGGNNNGGNNNGGNNNGGNNGGNNNGGNNNGGNNNGGNNNGGSPQTDVGGLIGAVNSAAQPPPPTNALDVLSQAEATFPGSNPTANAILNGIGGPAESGGGGGGSPQAEEQNQGGSNGGGSNGGGSNGGGNAPITVGGAVITPNGQNGFNVGSGATLTPGGTAVVAGTTLSLDSAGSAVVVNGVTQNIAQATGGSGSGSGSGANIPLLTAGQAVVTPNAATEYSIGPGATLTPGGQVVVDGTTLSLDSAASALVVNGVTRDISGAGGPGPITVGSSVMTANAASGYVVAPGTTLTPGGSAVVDGTTFSLDSGATELVVNGQTQDIGSQATMAPVLTIGGHTYSAINGGTTYVINGETLTMGDEETVTIDGTAYQISLAPSATRLIVETEDANGQVTATSTQTLFPQQGSGSGASATSSGSPEQQVGNLASTNALLPFSGLCFAFGSLFLAIWL